MTHTNSKSAERWQTTDRDRFEVPPAIAGAVTAGPGLRSDSHPDRTAWIVLIIGLFALTWMVLMRDVRIGPPAQVTSMPLEVDRGAVDAGSGTTHSGSSLPSAGAEGK